MEENRKHRLFIGLRILISILLLGILIYFADIEKVYKSLCTFQLPWLFPVFGIITLSVFISALKWGILLEAQNCRIGLFRLFRIYLAGLFFNNFLPSGIGGDGIRIVLAGKYCRRTAAAAASVVMERAIAAVSLSLLGLAGALFAEKPYLPAVWLLAVLLPAGIIVTYVLITGWVPAFIRKKENRIGRAWVSFSRSAGELKKQPVILLKNLFLSMLFQITVAMVVASVMGGLNLPIPGIFDLFFITSAASVLTMVPAGLNGYGLREGAYILLLRPFGYSISSAFTVSVLFAVFVSIFSLTGGIAWMTYSGHKARIKEDAYE